MLEDEFRLPEEQEWMHYMQEIEEYKEEGKPRRVINTFQKIYDLAKERSDRAMETIMELGYTKERLTARNMNLLHKEYLALERCLFYMEQFSTGKSSNKDDFRSSDKMRHDVEEARQDEEN